MRHATGLLIILIVLVFFAVLPELAAATRYIRFSYTDGDPLNDWITHVSEPFADYLVHVGTFVAAQNN